MICGDNLRLAVYGMVLVAICISSATASTWRKRGGSENQVVGNFCPESSPWPCKTSGTCLSFDFICDGTPDCPDEYDEDAHLCTAKGRPAKELLENFIDMHHKWLSGFLGDGDVNTITKLLIESKNIDEYAAAMKFTEAQKEHLRKFLEAIKNSRQIELLMQGMPAKAWNHLFLLFGRIVESGFLEQ